MKLARKVEIQPTPTQRQALLQHAGNARWAYNWGLRRKMEAWTARKAALVSSMGKDAAPKVPTAIDLHRELNVLKKTPKEQGGVPWMYEASKSAPQEALRDLDRAFLSFFRRVKAGEQPGFPRFKARSRGIGGFRVTGSIRAEARAIILPRLGRLRIKPGDRGYLPAGTHGQASVTERAGRWYVSVLGPEAEEASPSGGPAVGIDLGVSRLATLSDGTVIENPRALAKAEHKIKQLQKEVSRKKKGSVNRRKARSRLARAHARAANIRRDALHKATTTIAKSHGKVMIEDLKVRNMTRRRAGIGRAAKAGLNRMLLDVSFSEFRRLLAYKAKMYGCEVVAINPAYTSQRCAACGHVEAGNRLSQIAFRCLSCRHEANADLNAAMNILVAGSCPDTENAWGADGRRCGLQATSQFAMKQESAVAT
ncbi:MAG TPA: transposase [Bacillota bacterium]|nr:transposase [Bacillota bacterium]